MNIFPKLMTFIIAFLSYSSLYAADFGPIAQCKHYVSDAAARDCINKAKSYAKTNIATPGEAEKAANYIREFDEATAAVVYNMILTSAKDKDKLCATGAYTRSAMTALRTKDEEASQAGLAIAKTCYGKMADELKDGLAEKYEPYMKKVCPLLEDKKALKSLVRKKCEPYLK